MTQLNPRTIAQASKFGDNIYELILSNWGNRGIAQDAYNGSILFPATKSNANGSIPIVGQIASGFTVPSLAGIAIAPRSDIDRCILHYALPQTLSTESQTLPDSKIDKGFVNQGGILETEQVLSVHTPLIGQQPGPIIIRAHPMHWYSDTYQQSEGTSAPYGTALPTNPNGDVWNNPELRLLLYLTSQHVLPHGWRAPFHYDTVYTFTSTSEQLVTVVPVMGRKNAKVSVKAAATSTVITRLTGTIHTLQPFLNSTPFATQVNSEVELTAPFTVAASQGVVISACEMMGVSFLLFKATASVGQVISVSIDAFD